MLSQCRVAAGRHGAKSSEATDVVLFFNFFSLFLPLLPSIVVHFVGTKLSSCSTKSQKSNLVLLATVERKGGCR